MYHTGIIELEMLKHRFRFMEPVQQRQGLKRKSDIPVAFRCTPAQHINASTV